MILNKNSVQTLQDPIKNYDVTSSFKIPNWHELAMHQYLTLNLKNPESAKIIQNQYEQIPLLHSYIKIYDSKRTIDFSDQKAVISLTRCIMKVVFDIDWKLPISNLCPRVPNRINYLVWIHSYVIKQSKRHRNCEPSQSQEYQKIIGVDLGTGASLIYPLLGTKLFGWSFIATQIDQQSISCAQSLIKTNNLSNSIEIRQPKSPHSYLILNTLTSVEPIDFLMCNPPFFDTSNPSKDPLSAMTQNQHNIEGGEYEFFFTLYVQSFHFSNIGFFTMMIGLGRNFQTIRRFLTDEYEVYGVLEQVRFGRINQADNTRFIVGWKVINE